jgi:hypothetical protein
MCYDLVRQQFALHLQAPVLTLGNPSAPHRLGESSIGNDIWTTPDARQKPLMEKLVCMILFVGGWLLRSKPMCDWKSQKTKDFKKEGSRKWLA